MITLELKRGKTINTTVVRSRGRETGKSIIVDATELDIDVEVALKWGNSDDPDKAIAMIDPATDEQITFTASAGDLAGVQLKDIIAPFIFILLTLPDGIVVPVIDDEDSTPADVSCDITASVNPGGSETTVYIEYGTEEGEYTSTADCTESPLAAGTDDESVSVTIEDLEPETAYYWRVVAVNSIGTVYGEEQTFTTTATE